MASPRPTAREKLIRMGMAEGWTSRVLWAVSSSLRMAEISTTLIRTAQNRIPREAACAPEALGLEVHRSSSPPYG